MTRLRIAMLTALLILAACSQDAAGPDADTQPADAMPATGNDAGLMPRQHKAKNTLRERKEVGTTHETGENAAAE